MLSSEDLLLLAFPQKLCWLQVDRDGTVIQGECMDSSSSDCDDASATEMQCEQQDATAEAPVAVPLNSQHPHSAASKAPMLDADGFTIVQKPSRRQPRHTPC